MQIKQSRRRSVPAQKGERKMAALTRDSAQELLSCPDCEGLGENGRCKWLRVSACIGESCGYCRKKGAEESTWTRLRGLDEEAQAHISKKYYNGTRPWSRAGNGGAKHV